MKTRSVLISFPGYRFKIETLLPNHRLALLAASLREAGHHAVIKDYGTAAMLERLFPPKTHPIAQGIADRVLSDPGTGSLSALAAFWQLRGIDRALRSQQDIVISEIAAEITSSPIDFAVIDIEDADGLRSGLLLAERLRKQAPSLRLVAVGAFAEQYAESLLRVTNVFDCIPVQDADWSLAHWAERLDRPDTWRLIPNLIYIQHEYIRPTNEQTSVDIDTLPNAAYDKETYPALHDGEKLLLPAIEVSRASLSEETPRTRSARAICDETALWSRKLGTSAFRFVGPESPASHIDALAYEILARGQSIWYSRAGAIHEGRQQSFATLKSSGCQALTFDIGTGSQMLLEDYYGHKFGVSQAEQMLMACKQSGIFTSAGFTYPCAADDYHSRAETLRLVERVHPDSALARMPSFTLSLRNAEKSAKKRLGPAFSTLNVTPDEYIRYLLSGRDRFSVPAIKSREAGYYRHIRSLADVLRENDVLIREFAGVGVCGNLTSETALIARVCGYEGQEEDFTTLFRQRLFTGDASGVSAAVSRFNQRAGMLSNMVAFKPFTPALAVVGN